MKIVDISDEIHRELSEEVQIPVIAFWLRTNIGRLNTLIHTSFRVSADTLEFSPDLEDEEKDIFKKLYMIQYYDEAIRRNLGSAGTEIVIEVESDGAKVRRANKTELSKTYLQAKKDEYGGLKDLVNQYKVRKATPIQVAGDDDQGFIPQIRNHYR